MNPRRRERPRIPGRPPAFPGRLGRPVPKGRGTAGRAPSFLRRRLLPGAGPAGIGGRAGGGGRPAMPGPTCGGRPAPPDNPEAGARVMELVTTAAVLTVAVSGTGPTSGSPAARPGPRWWARLCLPRRGAGRRSGPPAGPRRPAPLPRRLPGSGATGARARAPLRDPMERARGGGAGGVNPRPARRTPRDGLGRGRRDPLHPRPRTGRQAPARGRSPTDGGLWDRDAGWDRAVGPMQFIASTRRPSAGRQRGRAGEPGAAGSGSPGLVLVATALGLARVVRNRATGPRTRPASARRRASTAGARTSGTSVAARRGG